jgi:hypothetical protein
MSVQIGFVVGEFGIASMVRLRRLPESEKMASGNR